MTTVYAAPDESYDIPKHQKRKKFWALLIGSIGVVYGDIGTSPLYAFRETLLQLSKSQITPVNIYGILSLTIWTLIVIVTLKYVLFLLRADNKGEGGILSLMALLRKSSGRFKNFILYLGIIGASLFYGDAAITPAISVMSAVEGLKLVTPIFDHYILGLSVLIICLIFAVQKKGTATISKFFGPITILWFLVMAAMGLFWIMKDPKILLSFSPHYAVLFLFSHGWLSFFVLGAVFLSVTGAEALYADMGHFGRLPIQRAWIFFIFPALILNYMGQGVLVLQNPSAVENPFYLMVPDWLLLPIVGLATCATIIASQAVITGAYSLTQQAIQLGLLPRMDIRYTSHEQSGQIYIPKVNRILLVAVLFLCILFQSSMELAAAYGIAVSGTMVITTVLSFLLVTKVWNKKLFPTLLVMLPVFIIELVFLSSNSLRLLDGGFVPVLFAGYMVLVMTTWIHGSRYLAKTSTVSAVRITDFSENLDRNPPHIVKGTAIFFTSDPLNTPEALLKNIQCNQIIHEQNIILTVVTSHFPAVPEAQRMQAQAISSKLTRVILHFGYMETPDVLKALTFAKRHGFDIDIDHAIFFFARRKIVSDPQFGLPAWRDKIYISLARFAIGEHDFFRLPRAQVIELGVQVTI